MHFPKKLSSLGLIGAAVAAARYSMPGIHAAPGRRQPAASEELGRSPGHRPPAQRNIQGRSDDRERVHRRDHRGGGHRQARRLHRARAEHDAGRNAERRQRLRGGARHLAGAQQRAFGGGDGRRRARNQSRRSSTRICSTSSRSKCSRARRARCTDATPSAAPSSSAPRIPGDEFEGRVKLGYGNESSVRAQAGISGPIGDIFKYRASINYYDTDGFLPSTFLGGKADPVEEPLRPRAADLRAQRNLLGRRAPVVRQPRHARLLLRDSARRRSESVQHASPRRRTPTMSPVPSRSTRRASTSATCSPARCGSISTWAAARCVGLRVQHHRGNHHRRCLRLPARGDHLIQFVLRLRHQPEPVPGPVFLEPGNPLRLE